MDIAWLLLKASIFSSIISFCMQLCSFLVFCGFCFISIELATILTIPEWVKLK